MLNKVRQLLQLQRGLLLQYGWLRSWWLSRPVDAEGQPLPWITYPAIDFLSQFDFSNASVFEWGSGSSTAWWAKRCRHITSVESNERWLRHSRRFIPASVELIVTPLDVDAEIEALLNYPAGTYDVFVIDNNGPFRWRCAAVAAENLRPGGMIVLDNSDQCPKACEVLRRSLLTQIDFTGFVPCNGYAHTTSIFFRQSLRFQPRDRVQPHASPAQPNPPWEKC